MQTLKYGYFDSSNQTVISLEDAPPEHEWAKYTSVGELFLSSLEKHSSKVIIIEYDTGKEFTGKEILETARKFASFLLKNGIQAQDVIYNYLPNTFLYVCMYVAIQLVGGIFSGIVYQHPKREVLGSVQRTEANVITCYSGNRQVAEEVADETDSVKMVILFDESVSTEFETKKGKRVVPISKLLQEESKANDQLPVKVELSSISCLLHSSGTTGTPKAIIKSQRNNLYLFYQNVFRTRLASNPFAHISGFSAVGGAIVTGEQTVLLRDWHQESWLDAVQKYQIEQCIMAPSRMVLIAKSPLTPKYDLSSLKLVNTGGAPVLIEVIRAFKQATGVPEVGEIYGSSEMGGATLAVISDNFASAGRLGVGVKARIYDSKTGQFLGLGKQGEVCMQTLELSPGYYKCDKRMEDEYVDGFFRSGDIGYFNEDGILFIVGRIKEMIKVGANQVAPKELETILLEHDAVEEAAVAGAPDETYGQLPRAFVVLKQDGPQISENELKEFVDSKVGSYKKLEGGLVFVKSIPKISIGKLDKNKLLEMYPRTRN